MARRQKESGGAEGWPWTPFQEWLDAAVERRGINLKALSEATGADYSHLWKIARGNPARYPTSRRPGYEVTVSIGRVLGDVDGALKAAGYPTAPGGQRIPLGGGYELTAPEGDPNAQKYAEIFAQVRAMIERGEAVDPGEPTAEDFKVAEEIEKEREAGAGADW